jgi:uncharacterized damage-inducible protein DinB
VAISHRLDYHYGRVASRHIELKTILTAKGIEMDPATRKQVLESFGAAPVRLEAVLTSTDREKWRLAPAPNEWSIRQIIFHIADGEANYFIRLRKAVAESGGLVVAYNQNLWTDTLDYPGRSTDEALELFRLLRLSSYRLLVQLPEKAWANWVQHSERGKMTLDELLEVGDKHIAEHVQQIKANAKLI